jgi:catechol 2,3-dioxygenase-like lactoylglutathione lyase family enzyme
MPTYEISTVVAPVSNFENLRKQAKLFLRWHREEYYPVATRIRAVLPRYRHLSDSQVLGASFKLSDAQELIAREHGFESWQALKAGVPVMSEHVKPVASRVAVIAAEPQFFVADIKASCDFFTRLGFSVEFLYGEPPFYGQVKRDGARINLRCVDRPVIDPHLRDRESLLSAAVTVGTGDEVKQLFIEFQAAGVNFFQTLRKEPWGAKNFIVKDPDGNLLLFAGPAD